MTSTPSLTLLSRPPSLSLHWDAATRAALPWMQRTYERWEEWLSAHQATDEQVLRKLIVDLLPDYEVARHYGSPWATAHQARYDYFNSYTSKPIASMAEYFGLASPLLRKIQSGAVGQPGRDPADLVVAFIVDGFV